MLNDVTKKRTIQELAHKLMHEFLVADGTYDWTFEWSNRKRAFGDCNYRYKRIRLSWTLSHGEEMDAIDQTLRHEIAHARAGRGTGHGPIWKAQALLCGVRNPKSCRDTTSSDDDRPTPSWVVVNGLEIMRRLYRRPSAEKMSRVSLMYYPKRRQETMGNLRYLPYAQHLKEVKAGVAGEPAPTNWDAIRAARATRRQKRRPATKLARFVTLNRAFTSQELGL